MAGFLATVEIVLPISHSWIFLHIDGIKPAVINLKISLLRHHPRKTPLVLQEVVQPPRHSLKIVVDCLRLCVILACSVLITNGIYPMNSNEFYPVHISWQEVPCHALISLRTSCMQLTQRTADDEYKTVWYILHQRTAD